MIYAMSIKYRTEIDGLRAIAVLAVIIYHAFPSVLPGGFVGVDIFFVISGFLITGIIIKELQGGGFSIVRFYERRARRILPALFFVVVVVSPFAYLWLLPSDFDSFLKSIIAVLTFTSNFLFASESGYFAPNVELKPLLHTWTLAVEEQYYIFFPLLLCALWRFGKKISFIIILIISVISLALAQVGSVTSPTNTFYLLHARAWELLIGSMCAFYYTGGKVTVIENKASTLSLTGLLMLIASIFFLNKGYPYPSAYTLIPTIGSALILLFATSKNTVGKLLSIKPVAILGLISYSAYLWHQPIFALARNRDISEPKHMTMVIFILLTLALSYFSWKYIETPFRKREKFSKKSIFSYSIVFTFSLITCSSLLLFLNTKYDISGKNELQSALNYRLRGNLGLNKVCEKAFTLAKECRTSDQPEIVLWGDSYAMQMAKAITSSNENAKLIQFTISQCSPVLGYSSAGTVFGAKNCIDSNNKVFDYIKRTDSVKTVVLSSPFVQLGRDYVAVNSDDHTVNITSAQSLKILEATIEKITNLGKKVVIISPTPESGYDIGQCLKKSNLIGRNPTICNFKYPTLDEETERVLQNLRSLSHIAKVVMMESLICDNGECHAYENNVMIYRDKGHLSYEGSEYLGRKYNFYKIING
ncbi:TPA: acyltransferase family protein [Enterobacter cloacae]|uniref:acyltransferase family protein n=1 Tax=Enterobacter cloacae TaxID=550 RepID=UPI0006526012|nr:acyltransferase family protein [Enterobacter cloacae]MBF4112041.1 acyltransferase [Enterobacter cloacae]MDT8889837.1 acyltransferase family protein [Enterobacter cloacae]HEW9969939.1 acyltransferase [Enterobacter cloacae]